MRIDAHQHFWQLERNDYGWLTADLAPLYKDFLPNDLAPLLKAHNIAGTILVQAAPSDAETDYLIQLSNEYEAIKGVIGWVDLNCESAPKRIAELSKHRKIVGIRPMIQDIDDIDWILKPNVAIALQALVKHQLVFDALVLPKHLRYLKIIANQHPKLKIVINHGAKPNIKAQDIMHWRADLFAFSELSQVTCKLSGLVTEADSTWLAADLLPYIETLFEVFGDQRIIWGSDWPVCLLASSYDTWIKITKDYIHTHRLSEQDVFGHNAIRVYNLTHCL